MPDRAAQDERLRELAKMEALAHLTGGVAHDFNNLLQIVLANISRADRLMAKDPAAARTALANAKIGGERAATLASQLLAFARKQTLNIRPEDINKLVREVAALMDVTLGRMVSLDLELDEAVWTATADASQAQSALINLCLNARDAMPQGGSLVIRTSNATVAKLGDDLEAGDYVVVAVADNGTGMAPEVLRRVFEPFFTTKPIGEGTGMGLSQVYGFTKQLGGSVHVESTVGKGTTVRIYLPRAQENEVE